MSELATWRDDASRTYYFIMGYAHAAKLQNTRKALVLAKKLHEGQYRKGGAEYLVHPLRVCNYLISLGYCDDVLLASAMLHDAGEDVEEVNANPQLLTEEYEIPPEIVDLVVLLTKPASPAKPEEKARLTRIYYDNIAKDWRALLIKLSDRANNVSTLDSFTTEKMKSYIEETVEYVLPLCSYAKLHYPELSDAITAMKYHITSVCSLADALISRERS